MSTDLARERGHRRHPAFDMLCQEADRRGLRVEVCTSLNVLEPHTANQKHWSLEQHLLHGTMQRRTLDQVRLTRKDEIIARRAVSMGDLNTAAIQLQGSLR